MTTQDDYIIRAGQAAKGEYALHITPEDANWAYSGYRIATLADGAVLASSSQDDEVLVVPMEGSVEVSVEGWGTQVLAGRRDIWTAITDFMYIPHHTDYTVRAIGPARVAIPTARANQAMDLPPRYCPVDGVAVELRGTGNCSRQVNRYVLGNEVETSRILFVEVLTPGGNWSSYPPHKHDQHNECERVLEEIYYFEVRPAANGTEGFALHRTYGSPGKPIDICTEIRSGDLVLTPHGYHGPCAAAPGYDLYYANVMAGPGDEVSWLMTDDPQYAWLRDTWADQPVDPRLPMIEP